jgi:chemotaxis protein methyltransferase CheR
MKSPECTEFLQRCLPRLRLRWSGYRKVRQQVCKRLSRRISELGLSGLPAYKRYLEDHAEEWPILDSLCHITISRFYRDRSVFDTLRSTILPSLAESISGGGENELRCWSVGCCSGEEAYTLQILWKISVIPLLHTDLPLRIIATDADPAVLERARRGCYPESSLRDLPNEWREPVFSRSGTFYTVKEPFRSNIEFVRQDIREQFPDGPFHLILCRNLAFTYFEESLQREILERITERLVPGGILVIGLHETIPNGVVAVAPYDNARCIYRKIAS